MVLFFKVIGIVFVVFVIAVVLLMAFVRRKLSAMIQSAMASQPPPLKIKLQELPVEEQRQSEDLNAALEEMKSNGFKIGKSYFSEDMYGLEIVSAKHKKHGFMACVYNHLNMGIWVDICIEFENGLDLTLTNGNSIALVMKKPPWEKSIAIEGASINELCEVAEKEMEGKEWKSTDQDQFAHEFEAAFEKKQMWHFERGGVSEEEILAIMNKEADNSDEMDELELKKAIAMVKGNEIRGWSFTFIDNFERLGILTSVELEKHRGSTVVVRDTFHATGFVTYLDDEIGFEEDVADRLMGKAVNGFKPSEVISLLQGKEYPDFTVEYLGRLDEPAKVELYSIIEK